MNTRIISATLAAILSSPTLAAPADVEQSAVQDAKAFLQRMSALAQIYSLDVLSLYADEAVIHAKAVDARADAKPLNIKGSHWKSLLREAIEQGVPHIEVSNFHRARVEQIGERLVVRAQRYSTTRCYWDNNYQLVLVRQSAGAFKIVEETLGTRRDATCRVQAAVPAHLPSITPMVARPVFETAPAESAAPGTAAGMALPLAGAATVSAYRDQQAPPAASPSAPAKHFFQPPSTAPIVGTSINQFR